MSQQQIIREEVVKNLSILITEEALAEVIDNNEQAKKIMESATEQALTMKRIKSKGLDASDSEIKEFQKARKGYVETLQKLVKQAEKLLAPKPENAFTDAQTGFFKTIAVNRATVIKNLTQTSLCVSLTQAEKDLLTPEIVTTFEAFRISGVEISTGNFRLTPTTGKTETFSGTCTAACLKKQKDMFLSFCVSQKDQGILTSEVLEAIDAFVND